MVQISNQWSVTHLHNIMKQVLVYHLTNNAYAQLVSIFTINCDIAIYADTGAQCDLTNSNSSFGNFGLVAVGLGINSIHWKGER